MISGGAASIKRNYFVLINNRHYGEAAGSVYYGPTEEQIKSDIDIGIDFLNNNEKLTVVSLYNISLLEIN